MLCVAKSVMLCLTSDVLDAVRYKMHVLRNAGVANCIIFDMRVLRYAGCVMRVACARHALSPLPNRGY
jgi:hypothetical protein